MNVILTSAFLMRHLKRKAQVLVAPFLMTLIEIVSFSLSLLISSFLDSMIIGKQVDAIEREAKDVCKRERRKKHRCATESNLAIDFSALVFIACIDR